MSSYRQDTNISFVAKEIGKSSPTEVRIDIDRSSYVLGTMAGSAMKFDEHHVSRKHATIEIVEEKVYLVDQSTVGTWVNGVSLVRKQPFPLMVGDRINLGSEHTVLMVGGEGGTLENLLMRNPKPELELDVDGRAVFKNGFDIRQPLTPTEFDVLSEMYQHKGQVITFERIWAILVRSGGRVYMEEGTDKGRPVDYEGMPEGEFNLEPIEKHQIRQRISDLRKKIERPGSKPVIVLNSTGAGYKMPRFKFLDTPPFTNERQPMGFRH